MLCPAMVSTIAGRARIPAMQYCSIAMTPASSTFLNVRSHTSVATYPCRHKLRCLTAPMQVARARTDRDKITRSALPGVMVIKC